MRGRFLGGPRAGSESPTEPFRSLVVWGAEAPESAAPEARGATVSACE